MGTFATAERAQSTRRIEFSLMQQERTRQALATSAGERNRARQPTPASIVGTGSLGQTVEHTPSQLSRTWYAHRRRTPSPAACRTAAKMNGGAYCSAAGQSCTILSLDTLSIQLYCTIMSLLSAQPLIYVYSGVLVLTRPRMQVVTTVPTDHEEVGLGGHLDVEQPGDPQRVEDLPPLPEPNHKERASQACCGCTVVFCIIGVLVGIPHAHSRQPLYSGQLPRDTLAIGQLLLYIEAAIALFCLAGLMFGDPGVLKRSQQRCFPLPPEVLRCLRAGQVPGRQNLYTSGGQFCVRCLIWRPEAQPPTYRSHVHHCSICRMQMGSNPIASPVLTLISTIDLARECSQADGRCVRVASPGQSERCVSDFDHHCGVFGRCIAGEGWRGNMGYFKGILLMFVAGLITCTVTISDSARR